MPKVKVKVPKLSGFDKSHQNLLTTKCGTLTPILCDEVIPNTPVHLKDLIAVNMPPLASDTYMRVNLKVEAFFVPTRLLYGGFESWITDESIVSTTTPSPYKAYIPVLNIPASSSYVGVDKLSDYLGIRTVTVGTGATFESNIFPFLAYHKVYDDWYRNTLVQTPVFQRIRNAEYAAAHTGTPPIPLYALPYSVIDDGNTATTQYTYDLGDTFADGVHLGDLRQRNFGFDYFTCAMPSAQQGNAQSVSFNTSGSTGSFTIASLRAANSLQQWKERNQLAGSRLQDYVEANYGANLSTGVAQRSILLGSGEVPVYSKGVYQTSNSSAGMAVTNPFGVTGSTYGSVDCNGELNLINDFVAQEPGYILVLASLVPVVSYASGIERMFFRYNAQGSQTDMANPILQNVGNQPIYQEELTGTFASGGYRVFGYSDRYADFKYRNDQIHGLFRNGQNLDSFVLQRNVSGTPTLSSSFLEIPTNYMNNITAVVGAISQYGCWIDCYHDYKVAMPIDQYSIPSLQDPAYEHGKDVDIEVGGSRL